MSIEHEERLLHEVETLRIDRSILGVRLDGAHAATREVVARWQSVCAERDALRAALCDVLDSASPNKRDHPSMSRQWERALELLKATEPQP